jgi:hypothetical protein
MFQRLTLSLMLVVAGFFAGLVVTGRMRTAADSSAAERSLTPAEPQPRVIAAPPSAAAVSPAPIQQPAGFSGGGPDFTRVAGIAVKGVANISSLQVVRTRNSPFPNDPFFRYFFGDDD